MVWKVVWGHTGCLLFSSKNLWTTGTHGDNFQVLELVTTPVALLTSYRKDHKECGFLLKCRNFKKTPGRPGRHSERPRVWLGSCMLLFKLLKLFGDVMFCWLEVVMFWLGCKKML